MFSGNSNVMEGKYIVPPPPGFSFPTPPPPMGYIPQPPGTLTSYPNGPAIVSPIYYVSSLSPPMQQISSVPYMTSDINSYTNNSSIDTVKSPPSSTCYDERNLESGTSSSDNEFANSNNDTKTKIIEIDKKVPSSQSNSPIDETSSALLVTDRFAVKLEPNKFIHGVPATKWYTLSDEEREGVLRDQRRVTSFKTALCISYRLKGTCSFGENCRFAHSLDELKPPPVRHPKYKTQLCDKFSATGICPYGSRCNFIHATKSGQIVSDYPKYLACLQKEALNNDMFDDDEEEKTSFAVSMNSIPKNYSYKRKIESTESTSNKYYVQKKPPQVINFSKSFGTSVIKTLFEKGKPLKNVSNEKLDNRKEDESRCFLDGCDGRSTISNISRTSSSTYNSISITEKKEDDSGKSVLERLFVGSRKCENIQEEVKRKMTYIDDEDLNDVYENDFPGSKSYTNGYWKKNYFRPRNAGYYSQSRVPTFLRFDNV